MSENKSGFEIRADLLNLADGLLNGNYDKEANHIYSYNDNHPENRKDIPIRSILPQDVIEVAKQFNEFVKETA